MHLISLLHHIEKSVCCLGQCGGDQSSQSAAFLKSEVRCLCCLRQRAQKYDVFKPTCSFPYCVPLAFFSFWEQILPLWLDSVLFFCLSVTVISEYAVKQNVLLFAENTWSDCVCVYCTAWWPVCVYVLQTFYIWSAKKREQPKWGHCCCQPICLHLSCLYFSYISSDLFSGNILSSLVKTSLIICPLQHPPLSLAPKLTTYSNFFLDLGTKRIYCKYCLTGEVSILLGTGLFRSILGLPR